MKSLLRVSDWAYAGGRRDLRLDLLRGFAAFAMIADHIGGERSWLYAITGGNRFIVSAAEAFVFISGVVMGIVYGRVMEKDGVGAAVMKALRRAWTLYLVTVFLTLGFAALSAGLASPWAPDIPRGEVANFVLGVVTLHRAYFLTNIPLMYTLLLLSAGPVLVLLYYRKTAFVLAGSWLLWGVWQFSPEHAQVPWTISNNVVFNFPAWQVLFVTGIVLGYHRTSIETFLARISRRVLFGFLAVSAGIVGALYLVQLLDVRLLDSDGFLRSALFDKADVRVGRLVVFFFLAIVSFALTTVAWKPVRALTGWLLLPLGQSALTAYSLHVPLVALAVWLSPDIVASPSSAENAALQLAGVMIVWVIVVLNARTAPIFRQKLGSAIRRGRATPGAPMEAQERAR